jgi:hypothetical protein
MGYIDPLQPVALSGIQGAAYRAVRSPTPTSRVQRLIAVTCMNHGYETDARGAPEI